MIKKLFVGTILTVFIIVGLLITSISFNDYTKTHQSLAENFKIDSSLIKEKNISINKLPIPYLVIDQIDVDQQTTIKNIEIHFSIISLLMFAPEITSIKAGEAIVYLDNQDIHILNHDQLISELIYKDFLSGEAVIDKLTFVKPDSDVAFIIENFQFVSNESELVFSGLINKTDKLDGKFINSGNDDRLFKLNIKNQTYNLNIEENYKNNSLVNGSFVAETSGLSNKLIELIPDIQQFSNKINSNEKIKITFDVIPTRTHLNLKNIIIKSNSIAGRGEIIFNKNPNDLSDIQLVFTKIDVESWLKANSGGTESYNSKSNFNTSFDFNKNRMKTNIFIKNIKLDKKNSLNNVNLKMIIGNGKLLFQEFSGKIDKEGGFNINGVITQNSFRSLFKGKVVFNHKNLNSWVEYLSGSEFTKLRLRNNANTAMPFTFASDVTMSSVDLSLRNLLINTKDISIRGDISTKFIGDYPRTNAVIKFSSLDVDQGNFPIISQISKYITSLFDNMKQENYLNKFIPIRKINSISNYDISFDNILFNDTEYENVNFTLQTSPGKISINQLFIQKDNNWIDTNIALEAQGVKPVIYFTVNRGSMSIDFLTPSAFLDLRNKIISKLDLNKIDIVMNCSMKELSQNNVDLGRVLFQAKNNKNLLNIKKFDADLLGGRVYSSGSILLEPYTLNFVYALNSAHLDKIISLLPNNFLKTGGVLSARGMWSTHGNTLDEQLYNLYTKSNIVTKNTKLHNFSIDEFIQQIRNINYDVANLTKDIKEAMLTGETNISELKTDLELTKGDFNLSSLFFKTKYSAVSGDLLFNLYDFKVDGSAIFSFYLGSSKYALNSRNYKPTKITINAQGSPLSLKKTANVKELKQKLEERNK